MVTSFTDGTKVQAEQILVANHFGATLAAEGMLGPDVGGLDEASEILAAAAAKSERPISDYVVSPSLSHGVFIVARHDEAQRDALDYYKLGPGPNYTLIKPNILVHLEILKTIRRVVAEGRVLLDNSSRPELSLGAVAKRDIASGELIANAIGSFELRGHAIRISDHPDHLPIGLISEARVHRPIERGELVTEAAVEIPDSHAADLWREQILSTVSDNGAGRSVD
jgi:predicted homoserine dehydrogenase-like protein